MAEREEDEGDFLGVSVA